MRRSCGIGAVTLSIPISWRSTDVVPINTPNDSASSGAVCRFARQTAATSSFTVTQRPYP